VYKHEKFQKSFDTNSGFETKTMLCQPVENGEKEVIGVVQVLNRKDGSFTQEDEYLLAAICGQVSIALENSKLYTDILTKNESLTTMARQLEAKVEELDLLVDVERLANQSTSMDQMIGALVQTTCEVFKASGVFLTLSENESADVHQYVPTLDKTPTKVRIQNSHCIGRSVIQSGEAVVCQSDSISSELISEMPFTISSVVGVPLFDELEHRCIGALQAVHSSSLGTQFGEDELKVLGIIGSRVVAIIRAQAQREEMEKNKRMASMGQMLSGIIHDIKNPISIISGYVQLMARNEDAEKRKAFAKTIKSQFGLLDKMTRELLDYAKGQSSLLRRKLFVGDFFDSFEELLSVELSSRGIELQLQIDYRGALVADESKLQRTILNLARNAADSMPDGGKFTISVKEKDDFVELRFADSGEGIPEDIRGNLFDDFVTSGKENGTGLGLSIV
jgi:K+-sensing histidine kinase KdpD